MGTIELKHYGIKGMHWGVRRASASEPKPVSEDHATATAVREKIKTGGGVKAVSNKELQALVSRMNLEKQYSTLNPSNMKKALSVVNTILGFGNTLNQVVTFANSPSGKLLKDSLKAGK